jgi:hypothetical protein
VGKVSKEGKKRNQVRGGQKIKFQKKKKKLRSGLRKGKQKKSTWDGTRIELIHPRWCIGSLWPCSLILIARVIGTFS